MFNLLNIKKKQQQQQNAYNLDEEKRNIKTGRFSTNEKQISSQYRQIQSQGNNFHQQLDSQNVYLRGGTSQGVRQLGNVYTIARTAAHSQSSQQLQRLSSALKVQGGNKMSTEVDEEYDNVIGDYQQYDQSYNFGNYSNKFKRERIASAVLNSKYIKKLGPRPETGKINASQSMQQKYMDVFNQPKNLQNQIVSISETQNESKKFYSESRVKTGSTRCQTLKEIEQLGEIKDFKQIMSENVQKKQHQAIITFATLHRARTAYDQHHKPTSSKDILFNNHYELQNIADQSESSSKNAQQMQQQLPLRTQTACNPSSVLSSSSLQKEVRHNNNVAHHLKRHTQPKTQYHLLTSQDKLQAYERLQTAPNERTQIVAVSTSNPKESFTNNFISSNSNINTNNVNKNKEGLTSTQQQSEQQIKMMLQDQCIEKSGEFDEYQKSVTLITNRTDTKKNVQAHLDSTLKEKLKIDLSKSYAHNPASTSIRSPQTYSNTPKSTKGVYPTAKQSKLSAKNTHFNNNNNLAPPSLNHINNQHVNDATSSQKEEIARFQQKKEQFVFNFLNTNEEGVSQHELNLVIEEYKLPSLERDYEFLDMVAERLKFFKRFTKPTRLYLLKLANIIQYPTNQVIFNQVWKINENNKFDDNIILFQKGDEGDLMYVIIRGACHVRIKRINSDGKEDSLVVATLYDGQQFGELALMNAKKPQNLVKQIKANEVGEARITQVRKQLEQEPPFNKIEESNENEDEDKHQKTGDKLEKKKSQEDLNKMLDEVNKSSSQRAATIETCEITTLFTVSREYFKTILLGLIQKELDVKLKLLQTLSFFEYMDQVSLIPLANLVEVKKYKLGEILVREGQEPNNFYIVSAGRLKIIKEEVIVRSNFVMGREHKYSNKKLKFGEKDYTKVISEGVKVKKNTLVDNTKVSSLSSSDSEQEEEEEEDSEAPPKAANFEIIYSDNQNIAYQYQHEFGSLVRGDFFFGRSILWEYLKVDPSAEEEYSIDPRERAKLTVIADSAEIEVYILEKDKIHLIPNMLRRTMIDGLITRKEYDAIYTQEVSVWSKQWDKYKSNVLEQIKVERIYKQSIE